MPRGARIILEKVCYHIVNRGNQKKNIFLEKDDFEQYLRLLRHYKKKYYFRLFGYCLMPNHVHLLLELKRSRDLSRLMQSLTQTYTIWFNEKYKTVGRLWQGRFKSRIIHKDDYFLTCVYYLESNPVRANIVSAPGEYPWSSYKERIFGDGNGYLDLPDST